MSECDNTHIMNNLDDPYINYKNKKINEQTGKNKQSQHQY
jgi:hypothetical protein